MTADIFIFGLKQKFPPVMLRPSTMTADIFIFGLKQKFPPVMVRPPSSRGQALTAVLTLKPVKGDNIL